MPTRKENLHNIMRRETKLRFSERAAGHALAVKKDFQFYCVITGLSPEHRPTSAHYTLDCAHIFPRSTFPELTLCVENGLPIIHYRHSWRYGQQAGDFGCLDLKEPTSLASDRGVTERFEWLAKHTHEDFKPAVSDRLRRLVVEASKFSASVMHRKRELLAIVDRMADA